MGTEEKVLLGLALAALAAVIVFKLSPDARASVGLYPDPQVVGASQTPENSDVNTAPWYLGYNMPFAFGMPGMSPVAPAITEGQVGQSDVATVGNGDDGYERPDRYWFGV